MTRAVARDERGSAHVEYLILVVLFGLPTAFGFISLGLTLLEAYHRAQQILTAPVA